MESLARPMEEWGDGVRAAKESAREYAAGMMAALDHTLPPERLEEP
ncbi:hypothetical protein [Kyrpidia tusciae]|nr:hypothetical protein [Kyrpidia tusciae]